MKNSLIIITILLLGSAISEAQQERFEIEGAIQITDSMNATPDPGTIRWTGSDFEGYSGTQLSTLVYQPDVLKIKRSISQNQVYSIFLFFNYSIH